MSTILFVQISLEERNDIFDATIKTDIGEIRWTFESDRSCCECFGVELSQPLASLVGKKLINIDFNDVSEKDDSWTYTNTGILTIKLEDGDWTARFYNIHNGYYAHNLDIIIDGKTKWNISL